MYCVLSLPRVNHTAYGDLMRTIDKILSTMPNSKQPLFAIGKQVRRCFGQRLPFASPEEAVLSAQLDR